MNLFEIITQELLKHHDLTQICCSPFCNGYTVCIFKTCLEMNRNDLILVIARLDVKVCRTKLPLGIVEIIDQLLPIRQFEIVHDLFFQDAKINGKVGIKYIVFLKIYQVPWTIDGYQYTENDIDR